MAKTVCLGMSGGVDSALAAALLVEQGFDVRAVYMRNWSRDLPGFRCRWADDLADAERVAVTLGIGLEVWDCEEEYRRTVVDYLVDAYACGLTPNPDVMCNRLIKFGAFHEKRGHEYDLIATGHYAQTEWIDGKKWLVTSPDPVKDQTDFLAQIYDWQLQKAIFPIGHYQKGEVREIAEREHLINAKRKDSQGICFLGKINYNDYIRRFLGENPGEVLELETEKKIGMHRGLWFHTIGQRHGLGFGGGPWYAVKKDVERNVLFVSKGYEPATAYKKDFKVQDLHLLTAPLDGLDVTFKIRHTPEYHRAQLEPLPDGGYIVHAEEPMQGVAPGQFCVIYDKEHHRCFGSAEIAW